MDRDRCGSTSAAKLQRTWTFLYCQLSLVIAKWLILPCRLSRSKIELKEFSLIEEYTGKDELSLHRLVQAEIRYYLEDTTRDGPQRAFESAAYLLNRIFPDSLAEASEDSHELWPVAAPLLQHVLMLVEHYEKPDVECHYEPTIDFCALLLKCAR